ncbi:hypothetical protein SDC9_74467 [bioreactor metagenome]|uniref:Uncharacterized protein n=1 Tax=bioreactor metagenome TaxID=1076179 RepID=A0A644YHL8_9ZZZZ
MNTIELKNNFHRLIDTIENEAMLTKFYAIMSRAKESTDGNLWEKLSAKEQSELLLSFEESEDEINLIPYSEIRKKYEKWL